MVFKGKYEWLLKQDTIEPDIYDLDTIEPAPSEWIKSQIYQIPTFTEWLMEKSMHEMYGQLTNHGFNTMEASE